MIRVYRVVEPFEAQRLPPEPLHIETFRPGDLLIILKSEDAYTTFCRDEAEDLTTRDQFIVSDDEFQGSTDQHGS
jgi:hypothetical protein